ncbi:hypothetical protein [Ralstonia mannitolilytica]|uniref:hypothetical protein n=1 Tax=Ralstonia mannitolilytica TaxID=105219 RepID=UPI000CEF317D|nr:hypothetical protein [Ralstonia mannitolilytica]
MTAATADRDTQRRPGTNFSYPMKGGAKIFTGTLVCLAAGLAVSGGPGGACVGVAQETVDNTSGADGAATISVRRGELWRFDNSAAADQITLADVGSNAYIVDDSTVAKTNGGGTRSVAGQIRDVDSQGVWVAL